ncbi:MAG: glycosyltransferase, partial [Candidatus Margulisbacteria bacterium]|nr:glycosyltransferase [Candidatus Margulisiibacteriota bacterium]
LPEDSRNIEYGNFLLCPGRLVRYKRVDAVIYAMQYLPEIRLKIVGEGPEEENLKNLVMSLGLGNVEFIGVQESLSGYYKECLAVVCMSKDEDFGIVARESFAWRKPVVAAFDGGGICEAVVDGVTGLLAKATPEHLSEKIKLLYDVDRARGLGQKGYEAVRQFDWIDHSIRLKEVINGLV